MGEEQGGVRHRPIRWVLARTLQRASLLVGLSLIALPRSVSTTTFRQVPATSDVRALGEEAVYRLAARALARGRLDEAEAIAKARGPEDPAAVVVRARVAIARGRYADAETLLRPLAERRPLSEAAVELGWLLLRLGRRDESVRWFRPVLDRAEVLRTGPDLFRAARAAWGLGRAREANALFRAAAAAAPADPAINTAWGELFLEKHNRADAAQSFRAALDADSEWAPAHVGLARALADENAAAAAAAVKRALAIDPTSPEAHLLLAELALDEGGHEEARAALARVLDANPAHLEARALVAALAFLEDRRADFQKEVDRVLAINPRYGELYRIVAAQAARNYRFVEAVALARQALALDPANSRAYAELGMHLLRTGDEAEARQALERAFRHDPFDVVTYNLLGLLDTLDSFRTVRDGDLIVRLHPEEADVLQEYVLPLAREALTTLAPRYGVTVRGPILIEIFPRHDDFAVRNVGLPGMVGALGACFGRVVTLDSPRAREPGTFSWQAALWHELAHVVTLQASNQRVPRWLTEGISVYEESRRNPAWGRDQELAFAQALARGAVLKLRDLNRGFMSGETIGLAYYQASLLVEHLVERYGQAALGKLLAAYARGLDTDGAVKDVLGTTLERLQESFDEMLARRFLALTAALAPPTVKPGGDRLGALRAAAAAQPGSYLAQMALGRALYEAGALTEALTVLERAAALVPGATGAESPRALMAEIAEKLGDRRRALRELAALLEHDHTNIQAARRLAALAEEAGDRARQELAYARIVELDPFDATAHSALGRLLAARGDVEGAIREFRAAVAAGPVDPVGARCDLAESYLAVGRLGDAKREALAALELAPTYERAQELLLRVVEGRR